MQMEQLPLFVGPAVESDPKCTADSKKDVGRRRGSMMTALGRLSELEVCARFAPKAGFENDHGDAAEAALDNVIERIVGFDAAEQEDYLEKVQLIQDSAEVAAELLAAAGYADEATAVRHVGDEQEAADIEIEMPSGGAGVGLKVLWNAKADIALADCGQTSLARSLELLFDIGPEELAALCEMRCVDPAALAKLTQAETSHLYRDAMIASLGAAPRGSYAEKAVHGPTDTEAVRHYLLNLRRYVGGARGCRVVLLNGHTEPNAFFIEEAHVPLLLVDLDCAVAEDFRFNPGFLHDDGGCVNSFSVLHRSLGKCVDIQVKHKRGLNASSLVGDVTTRVCADTARPSTALAALQLAA